MQPQGFLGIDVSKGYADFLLLDNHKNVLEKSFQLDDHSAGRQQLKKLIEQWFSNGMEVLFCGVESTGGYENNWYSFLKNSFKQMNVHVVRLNARAVKAVADASLKRTITDAVSAHNIASYLISFPEKITYAALEIQENNQFKEGRQHYSYVRMLQKQKVQLNNQLEKLLYQYFGEILVYCRHGIPIWLLRMLTHYSCGQSVVKAGVKRLCTIKGISLQKAEALVKKARQSVQKVDQRMQHVITVTAKEILHKEEIIYQEKLYLKDQYQNNEEVQLVDTIKGIGVESAVCIMLEIEDVRRFASSKKIAAYFGIHPTFKQSGDGTWGSHMSKKGRSEIRAVLYMAALSGIRYNPVLKQIYARCRSNGMKHYQAMGVVMHKLLRIIYGVLKNKTAFDPNVDKQNQLKAEEKQKEKKLEDKKYRYQTGPMDAPISRQTAQKRKKQIAS